MQAVNWQQFGLKSNPYNNAPLIEGSELPIRKAFVGRKKEREFLNSLFASENRLCLTICGDVGVGKTSLANFHKFTWKYHNEQKLLFSFRGEIEACDDLLNKKSFLIEIIGSILREIKLLEPNLLNNKLLASLSRVVDISQTIAISGGIAGINLGINKTPTQPIQLSTTILEEYFVSLVDFIKNNKIENKKYSGIIVHVNNFDTVLPDSKKRVINFFNEIRDMSQLRDVYYLFLGPRNLFKDIISTQQRVRSIFHQAPLNINPLSKKEIITAFDERMKLLQSNNISKYIKPIKDEAIFRLYDIHRGDIREIMSYVGMILKQCSDKLTGSLSIDKSMLLLGEALWEQIQMNVNLTEEQEVVLNYLIEKDKVSQKEIADLFKKDRANISRYYFKPLINEEIIEEKEKIGNTPYWGLTSKYIPLKWFVESRKKLRQNVENESGQLSLKLEG